MKTGAKQRGNNPSIGVQHELRFVYLYIPIEQSLSNAFGSSSNRVHTTIEKPMMMLQMNTYKTRTIKMNLEVKYRLRSK